MLKSIIFGNLSTSWGGGEKWHFEHAQEFAKRGHRVLLICHSHSQLADRCSKSGLATHLLTASNLTFLNPMLQRALKITIKKFGADVIIVNGSKELKILAWAASCSGVSQIIYRRGLDVRIKRSMLNRYLLKKVVTKVISNSQSTFSNAFYHYKSEVATKATVLPNPIDLQRWDAQLNNPLWKSHEELVIGNLGRLVPQKDQRRCIEIAKLLKRDRVPFRMYIGGEGPLCQELSELITENGLDKQVKLVGFIDEPRQFMSGIDIFLLTSAWEGFGYVMIEAMAASKPVIAYNLSSNEEVVQDCETGFLVDNNAEMIKRIISLQNVELRLKLGTAGRRVVEERYSFDESIRRLEDIMGFTPKNSDQSD